MVAANLNKGLIISSIGLPSTLDFLQDRIIESATSDVLFLFNLIILIGAMVIIKIKVLIKIFKIFNNFKRLAQNPIIRNLH